MNLRDDDELLKEKGMCFKYLDLSEVKDINKWFEEYQKQPIAVDEERVRNYLECYKDLKRMIEYRKNGILSGKIKAESNNLEIDKLPDLDFLKESNISKEEFLFKVDYKLRELNFYEKNLRHILEDLRTYGLYVFQYVTLKYIVKIDEEQISKLIPSRSLVDLDNNSISYITNKLVEESKKEI